jgi:serine/threonine protein phosphatase PrpC
MRKPNADEIDVYGLTHTGKLRENNQDAFLIASINRSVNIHLTNVALDPRGVLGGDDRLAFLSMVADGVGGGEGGAEASATALETALEYALHSMQCYYSRQRDDNAFIEQMQEAAMKAHEAVRAKRAAAGYESTMATTLTLWLGAWPASYLLQVGDSRCYVFRDDKLHQVSRDQTMAEDLIDAGVLTRSAASRSPLSNVLSSAIGAESAAPVVTRMMQAWGNIGLLCSDGLTKHVSDEQIAQRLRTMTSSKQVCEQLVQDALDDGGTDNITVLVGRTIPKAPV